MEIITERRNKTDRRKQEIDFRRRKFLRREKKFVYSREIYLSDTNAYKNVYFGKYSYILGEAREDLLEWLLQGNREFVDSGIGLVTVETTIKYKASLYLFD